MSNGRTGIIPDSKSAKKAVSVAAGEQMGISTIDSHRTNPHKLLKGGGASLNSLKKANSRPAVAKKKSQIKQHRLLKRGDIYDRDDMAVIQSHQYLIEQHEHELNGDVHAVMEDIEEPHYHQRVLPNRHRSCSASIENGSQSTQRSLIPRKDGGASAKKGRGLRSGLVVDGTASLYSGASNSAKKQ